MGAGAPGQPPSSSSAAETQKDIETREHEAMLFGMTIH
jgi:hypothetical protein